METRLFPIDKLRIMADALNKYSTKSDYEAATHSSGYSEVSYIADRDITVYDGCNVETTRSPNVGDAVFLDASGKKRFIRGKGFEMSKVPNTWTKVGVVMHRKGKVATIAYHSQIFKKVQDCWAYKITPTSTTIVFRAMKAFNYAEYIELTFTASAAYDSAHPEVFQTELDTWLRANQPNASGLGGAQYDWHCEMMPWYDHETKTKYTAMCLIVNFLSWRQYNTSPVKSGATLQFSMRRDIGLYDKMTLRDKTENGFPFVNLEKAISVYRNASGSTRCKNEADYLADSDLTSRYPTYYDYMYSNTMAWPSQTGNQWKYHGTSYEWTTSRASQMFINLAGETVPMYGVYYYAKYPDGETGLVSNAFKWRNMGIDDGYELLCDIPLTTTGIVNETLSKLGGSNFWITANRRYWILGGTTLEEWCYYASYGYYDHNTSTSIECYALPVADYEIGS